ncbi:8-amino-7-oxononanoate synthase [Dasania marina]|uniref:8-amino-7-oxononanoate synthase n=1 Tax=Dasania marina TaxID=471499 RepID=UPI0030DAB8C8|tara:strand:- start:50096 stop:51262 length:1167 start_codon:yes stop_codon:yes gene_type:complete
MANLDSLSAALAQRKQQHLYRARPLLESAQGARVVVSGKSYRNFCSNDYLALANHPNVVAAFQQAANDFGVGSGGSHLVCGHSSLHHQLEEELAAFTGRDRVLLFSTGYMANVGIINALLGKQDAVFEDKLNHASLLDGGLLSGAKFQRFLHNDVASLTKKLNASTAERKLIVVDGVFSMDGDCAPLTELAALAEQQDAWLMVDDAHGFGVLGEQGAGCAEHFQLDQNQLPILMATLGKAAGSFGAFVAGSEVLIETLIQFARPYIYTTALPPAIAAASLASLAIIRDDSERRQKLQHLISHFKQQAQALGLTLMPSDTAIQPLLIGDSAKALAVSRALAEQGFLVGAIRPPTVANGTARLRMTLTADHSEQDVSDLLAALASVLDPL